MSLKYAPTSKQDEVKEVQGDLDERREKAWLQDLLDAASNLNSKLSPRSTPHPDPRL